MSLRRRVKRLESQERREAWETVPRFVYDVNPEAVRTSLRYVEDTSALSTSGAITYSQWGASDMFDPRTATGGHQPLEFDQFSVLYEYFYVLRSTIRVQVSPAAANAAPMYAWIVRNGHFDNASGPVATSKEVLFELNAQDIDSCIIPLPAAALPQTITSHYDAKKDGHLDNYMDGIALGWWGGAGFNGGQAPSSNAGWYLYVSAQGGNTGTAYTLVTIDYDCVFFGRINFALS